MTAAARLLEQRSLGEVQLRMEAKGVAVLREAGSAKCRIPRGSNEAILINTSGGLAGGDALEVRVEAGQGTAMTVTTQAAERVYRTLGPPARVAVSLRAEAGSTLFWMPRETILFEGSFLARRLEVDLAGDAIFCAVEPMIFGRMESGEMLRRVCVRDHWQVRREGDLVHAEALRLGPELPSTAATLGDNRTMATMLLCAPVAEDLLDRLRPVLASTDGASIWNGKLVARLLAKDSFQLRQRLVQALCICLGQDRLPKCWTF
jgi:urease accessory protein